jgi:uncharacterized protein
VSDSNNPFLLNVGFIVHQTVGYIREFPFDFDSVFLPPDTQLSDLNGVVRVTRTAQGLLVEVKLQAGTTVDCVRCLTEFSQPLVTDFTDLYAFNQNSVTESGLIFPENGKINLTPSVRDEMLVSIPINPVCKPDCKGLCPVCGENLNETSCEHTDENIDPRSDTLESLLE